MKKIVAMLVAATVSAGVMASTANASCTTFGGTATCMDGNTYTQLGNTVFGSNSSTGSSWSQTQFGNTTYGSDSNGNSWSH